MKRLLITLLAIPLPALAQNGSVKVWDGSNTASVRDTGATDSLNVSVVDGSGNQVTSFGGGVQYTEGDVDTSITGTACMMEGAANTMVACQGTAADGLLVNLGANNDVTGTVTCNAGTNLNTSALATETTLSTLNGKVTACNTGAVVISSSALPSGAATSANQSTEITSLQLLDDAVATTASAITTKGIAASGTDGTNARVLKTDTGGELQIDVLTMPTTTVTGTVAATQSGTWNVTNAGTFATQDSQTLADNAGFTDGTSKVWAAGKIYDEVAGTALTENDIGASRMNVNRASVGVIEDGATRGRYATVSASNALKVDGSAVTQPVSNAGTFAVQDSQAITDNAGFTDGNSKVFTSGFIYDEVAGTALTENDAAAARLNANRAQIHILEDATTRGRYVTVTSGNALKVDPNGSNATSAQTSVSDSATSVTILASNAARKGATIQNDSSAVLYLRLSSTAATSTTYTVRMAQYDYYEVPFFYTGQIVGIWATDPNDGGARVTEITQ